MNLNEKIEKLHGEYFEKLTIDSKTGYTKKNDKFRFTTYPYIGSEYSKAKKKILFIGMSVGGGFANQKKNNYEVSGIASLAYRNKVIELYKKGDGEERPKEDLKKHNPHIAGTYFTALYFLKESLDLEKDWEAVAEIKKSCQNILKNKLSILPEDNPLSYVALTNYAKNSHKDDKNMTEKDTDKKFIDKKIELNLLIDEIELFKPNIILFQSAGFRNKDGLIKKIKSKLPDVEIRVGWHPSAGKRGKPEYLQPEKLISTYKKA